MRTLFAFLLIAVQLAAQCPTTGKTIICGNFTITGPALIDVPANVPPEFVQTYVLSELQLQKDYPVAMAGYTGTVNPNALYGGELLPIEFVNLFSQANYYVNYVTPYINAAKKMKLGIFKTKVDLPSLLYCPSGTCSITIDGTTTTFPSYYFSGAGNQYCVGGSGSYPTCVGGTAIDRSLRHTPRVSLFISRWGTTFTQPGSNSTYSRSLPLPRAAQTVTSLTGPRTTLP